MRVFHIIYYIQLKFVSCAKMAWKKCFILVCCLTIISSSQMLTPLKQEFRLFGESLSENVEWNEPKISVFCTTCRAGFNEALGADDPEVALNATISLCIELGLGDDIFCGGIITLNAAEVLYIYNNTENLTAQDICYVLFGGFGCTTKNPDRLWEVPMPDVAKPPVDNPPLAEPDSPTMKILHLADTHVDPSYMPGADTTNCQEIYLCCRESNGIPENTEDGAGFWGDYRNCDSPMWTLEAIYQHIATTHSDIDLIVWTGDLVPHDVWETTKESNLEIIHSMADLVVKYFPGIPVYPSVGNHEASPMNQFAQPYITEPDFEMSWLYDELAVIWGRWLPEEAAANVSYGAYYSVMIKPGLKIISINSNYCYTQNYWLVLDSTDIARELELIAQELQDAEDNGERVYLIGHIPSGNRACSLTWSHEFNKIISRYEDTVSGIFYGHTHKDHYQLFFDPEDPDRVYEVAYIAQSQTTYSDLNPGYKIYTVEGDFNGSRYRVIDHENWIMDLEESNAQNQTEFSLLYSAREFYRLRDLSPESWLDLVYQMNEPNSTVFDDFYRNYVKAGTPSLEEGCNERCKSEILCRIVTSDNSDLLHCDALTEYS